MELKEYQAEALETFGRWREALEKARAEADKKETMLSNAGMSVSEDDRNYPKSAWEELRKVGEVPSKVRILNFAGQNASSAARRKDIQPFNGQKLRRSRITFSLTESAARSGKGQSE